MFEECRETWFKYKASIPTEINSCLLRPSRKLAQNFWKVTIAFYHIQEGKLLKEVYL